MNKLKIDLYAKIILNNFLTPPSPRVIFNGIHSWLEYKAKKTLLRSSPTSAVLYINKTCNYSCGFCYNKDVLNVEPLINNLFTVEDLKKFLSTIHGKRVLRIALMGGEPFINKNIFDLIRECKKNHKIVNIVSNGSLITDAMIPQIKESKLDAIGLSLYDNNPEHITRLVKLFNKYKINYWVQTVVDATKINEIESKLEFAQSTDIRNLILSNYNPYFDNAHDKVIRESHQLFREAVKTFKKKYSSHINIIWPTILPQATASEKINQKKCTLPFSYIHIDKEGTIAPCCYRYPKPEYGNLYTEDGWNSAFNQNLRENMLTDSEPVGECRNCENLYRNLYF